MLRGAKLSKAIALAFGLGGGMLYGAVLWPAALSLLT
jgi:hypothetical protein